MHPSVEPQSHSVILFRKNFELAGKPSKFIIHLSADNHYRLFVNGKYVTRGPARGINRLIISGGPIQYA